METEITQEDYLKIRKSDFGLVERKYQLSQVEISAGMVDVIKRHIVVEIAQFLLDQRLLVFEQEGNTLTGSLYVVKHPKGGGK